MILGLYEAHLPVRDLQQSIAFYTGLGLKLDHIVDEKIAFLWIVEESKLAWSLANGPSRIAVSSVDPAYRLSRLARRLA